MCIRPLAAPRKEGRGVSGVVSRDLRGDACCQSTRRREERREGDTRGSCTPKPLPPLERVRSAVQVQPPILPSVHPSGSPRFWSARRRAAGRIGRALHRWPDVESTSRVRGQPTRPPPSLLPTISDLSVQISLAPTGSSTYDAPQEFRSQLSEEGREGATDMRSVI